MAKRPRVKSGFTLGGEQAEADPLHEEAFVETALYEVLASKTDRRCFVVGRTGSGKSASLQHLEQEHPERVIRISPEDLALPYITDLQVIRFLDGLGVKLDLFWIALWKHVLLVEIIRRRYKINSPEAKQRFLGGLKDKFIRDSGKQSALKYFDDFEGRFWVEADERVRNITKKFTERLGAEGGVIVGAASASLNGKLSSGSEEQTESRVEMADRYQRIVNETQLARLNQMMSILDEAVLDDAHFTYVVIDDLDRDWVDEGVSNDLIRCLFRTVLDMQRVRNLKVLVALRTNIFQELDFGRSGGQEEKFRALILEMNWTSRALEQVLDERVKVAARGGDLEARSIKELLPHTNRARGNPLAYILDRTLLRPRDAIAFSNECLARAAGKPTVSWEDIQVAERRYSSNRLLALRDEWKPTYPGIDALLNKFSGSPARMTREQFLTRVDDCLMLLADPEFSGVRWLTAMSESYWNASSSEAWSVTYLPIASLLYRLGFIGASTREGAAPKFFGDDPLLFASATSADDCQFFYVHRMFQRALNVQVGSSGSIESGPSNDEEDWRTI